jgi:hypothetical protein
MAAFDRDQAQGPLHMGIHNLHHAEGGLQRIETEGLAEALHNPAGTLQVKRHRAAKEVIGGQATKDEVCVGDSRKSPLGVERGWVGAVTSGTGIGTGALRTHAQSTTGVEIGD